MKETLENKQKAVFYLLGELPDAERDLLEEQLFIDEDLSLFLNDVENDLIDEYVRGEFSSDEKLKFENAYLKNKTRREKVQAAQVLQTKLFNQTKENEPIIIESRASFWEPLSGFFRLPNFALAGGMAAILLVLFGAVWFLIQENKIDDRVKNPENINQPEILPTQIPLPPDDLPEKDQLNENLEINKNSVNSTSTNTNSNSREIEPKKTLESQKTPKTELPRRVFAFTLLPPTRSSQRPVLKIPENAEQINLQIINNFEKNFVKYTLEITNENGETILKKDFASEGKRPKKLFSLNLSRESLNTDGYEITLFGTNSDGNIEEINFYSFAVNKK